jgi:hypothetical protein
MFIALFYFPHELIGKSKLMEFILGLAFLSIGLSGIPIIISKEFTFKPFSKYSKLEIVFYGWSVIILGFGAFLYLMANIIFQLE